VDILVIETFSSTPHLETSGEICVRESLAGSLAGFAFIYASNPDIGDPRSLLERLLRIRTCRKVSRLQQLLSTQGVTLIEAPELPASLHKDIVTFATQNVKSVADLQRLSYKGAALGSAVAASLSLHTRDSDPDVSEFRDLIHRYLRASALVFESARVMIRQHQPKAVLVFNGRLACTRPIWEAARQLEVKCLFHERGATIERYAIFEKQFNDADYWCQSIRDAWDQAGPDRDEIGRSFFARRRNGDGIDWISFTLGQERGRVPVRRAGRRLVYYSVSEDEGVFDIRYTARCLFETQRDAVRFLIDWVARQANVELIIRVHPRVQELSARECNWWDSLRGKNVTLEPARSKTDSYALAESADLVLTYSSTMGVESSFLGKPVILLGDSAYRGFGCVYEPDTLEQLQTLLAQATLPPMPSETCIPYGYFLLTFGHPYQFYQPTDFQEGSFMGVVLSEKPELLRRFLTTCAGRALRKSRRYLIRVIAHWEVRKRLGELVLLRNDQKSNDYIVHRQ
jgi:hypothetical protein